MVVPNGHYAITTVTAASRTSGLTALALFDGATNGARFRAYLADTLVPVLRPGDTAVRDNLNVHKATGVREAVEAAGAWLLYLPPCSLDFNPIERSFAKLKPLIRTAAARNVLDLRAAIRQALSRFTPEEGRNSLNAAGYWDEYATTI